MTVPINSNGGSGGYIYLNISQNSSGVLLDGSVISANGGMGVGQGYAGSGGRIIL